MRDAGRAFRLAVRSGRMAMPCGPSYVRVRETAAKSAILRIVPSGGVSVPRSRLYAIVTDVHLWIPVVVLALGAILLLVLR